MTRAAYAQQADAVCQKANDALEALGEPDGLNDLPAYATQAAAIVTQERDDLEALQPPVGDEDRVDELNETLDAIVRVAKGLEKVAASGDPAAIDDFVKQNGAADREGQDAREGARHAGLRGVAVTRAGLAGARGGAPRRVRQLRRVHRRVPAGA